MVFLHVIFLLLLSSFPLNADEDKREFYLLRCREGAGMFSMFSDVLALTRCYEDGLFRGIEVDFANGGLYYDETMGLTGGTIIASRYR